MTERELIEKIVEVIKNTEFVTGCYPKNIVNIKQRTTYNSHSSLTDFVTTISFDFACVLADALLRSEIGDVSEWKHRAEVAELVVKNLNDIFTFDYQTVFEQAEKELEEERGKL